MSEGHSAFNKRARSEQRGFLAIPSYCYKSHDNACIFLQEAFEQQVNPEDREQMALLGEMRTHLKKVGCHELSMEMPDFKIPRSLLGSRGLPSISTRS